MEAIGEGSEGAAGVLNEARRFRRERRYPEALERHQWFHEHALEEEPGMYGVRLSFALADWIELGEEYPEARAALVEIRDDGESAIASGEGSFERFHDVLAINRALAEPSSRTVALFKTIDATDPDLATRCVAVASPALIEEGEFALLGRYLGDPIERFAILKDMREHGLGISGEEDVLGAAPTDPALAAILVEHIESSFAEDAGRLLTVLTRTGYHAEAEQVRDLILEVRDDPKIREIVSGAMDHLDGTGTGLN